MAKKGLHLNIYRLPGPDAVWRAELKLVTDKHGEGMSWRGTSHNEDTKMSGWWSELKEKLGKGGQALWRVLQIAKAALKNPAIVAAVPQYALPAIAATELISRAQQKGKLPELKKKLEDPTLKQLARELDEMDKGQRSAMSGGGICLACDRSSPRSSSSAARMRGASFPSGGKPSPFGLDSDGTGPFGLPQGNPHPFAEMIRRQIAKGMSDPLEMQKLAAMHDYQRRMARNSR